jgi:hypothetical protein
MMATTKTPKLTPEQLAASKARRLQALLADLRATYDTGDAPATLARRAALRAEIERLRAEGTPILSHAELWRLPR